MIKKISTTILTAIIIGIGATLWGLLLDVNTLKAERVSDGVMFKLLHDDVIYIRDKLDRIYETN